MYKDGSWRNSSDVDTDQSQPPQAPQQQAPPQGLVPKSQGFLSKAAGLVGLGGPTQTQDPKITKYASDNGLDYAHAAEILKARGYGK